LGPSIGVMKGGLRLARNGKHTRLIRIVPQNMASIPGGLRHNGAQELAGSEDTNTTAVNNLSWVRRADNATKGA
jgi:hypothetical protein